MKTIKVKDSFHITQEELDRLSAIKQLLLSNDSEIQLLGYKMLVQHPFYRRSNSTSLYIKGNKYSLAEHIRDLKDAFSWVNYPEGIHTRVYAIFKFFENLDKLVVRPSCKIPATITIK